MLRRRRSLLWLLAPFLLYIGALPFVNRVRPVVLGMPFFVFWMLLATLLTPLAILLAALGDPEFRADRADPDRRGPDRTDDGEDAA